MGRGGVGCGGVGAGVSLCRRNQGGGGGLRGNGASTIARDERRLRAAAAAAVALDVVVGRWRKRSARGPLRDGASTPASIRGAALGIDKSGGRRWPNRRSGGSSGAATASGLKRGGAGRPHTNKRAGRMVLAGLGGRGAAGELVPLLWTLRLLYFRE